MPIETGDHWGKYIGDASLILIHEPGWCTRLVHKSNENEVERHTFSAFIFSSQILIIDISYHNNDNS